MNGISIVMPVYNGAARLPRMLDCLAAQSCRDFELIAVNDGSTDGSAAVLRSYADRVPLRLVDKPNGGASSAYNRGLEEASGDYVFMLDQDDVLHPRAVEFMLQGMKASQADCLVFDYRDVDESAAGAVAAEFAKPSACPATETLGGDVLRWFIEERRNPGIWQFCFRRSALSGMRFVEGITLEDNLFVFPWLARNDVRFARLPVALYAYLQQPLSVMHTSRLQWRLDSFSRIFDGLRKALSDGDYRFLMTRHFVPELKSMWRAASFGGKRRFAGFMREMIASGLVFAADFPLRWRMKFLVMR